MQITSKITNTKLTDVKKAFLNVAKDGVKQKYKGEPWVLNMQESHIQGIARYKDYWLLTHNNYDRPNGYLFIMSKSKLLYKIHTPDKHFNHPGGCQIIGDCLAVPVENKDDNKSFIHFYALNRMTDTEPPAPLEYHIKRDKAGYDRGAGAVGMTNYKLDGAERWLLAVYDNGKVDFYLSEGLTSFPMKRTGRFTFTEDDEKKYSSICLLTDTAEKTYLVAFFRAEKGSKEGQDLARLYSCDGSSATPSLTLLAKRHFYTTGGNLPLPHQDVHFRWGAGLRIVNENSLEFFATQKEFYRGSLYTNIFPHKKS